MRLAILIMLVLSLPATASELTFYSGDNPPFQQFSRDGVQVSGLAVEVLDEMTRRAGVKARHHQLPWARSVAIAKAGRDTCVYSLARLAEREAQFQWVGPIATAEWAFFARDDFRGPIQSLEDARRYRVGSASGTASTYWLKENGFQLIDLSPSDGYNARKLANGRFDLWLAQVHMAQRFAQDEGINNIRPVLKARDVPYYLACSRQTSAQTVRLLQKAIDDMRQDGTAKRLEARYQATWTIRAPESTDAARR
ncbi:ABC transporter substrate-binding protein [Chitinimonas sp. BJYL2]|uniref:substrate-binding periplasmic protein n=1 Tax=Chitinimonas sp. BJYL2 TaxID=2976696 RepID=UPI0022B5B651|nr:transporter substrate-binding domain-containing protein [Chitinimonas sp. BJYL2]